MNVHSLAHTKLASTILYLLKKYRRQIIYKSTNEDAGETIGTLCRREGIKNIEVECCPDHIHMLVRIPVKYSVSEIVGYLKGKSALMAFERYTNLKYKYGKRNFWCRGYWILRRYSRGEYRSSKSVYTESIERETEI